MHLDKENRYIDACEEAKYLKNTVRAAGVVPGVDHEVRHIAYHRESGNAAFSLE
jgi:hypothetical protein